LRVDHFVSVVAEYQLVDAWFALVCHLDLPSCVGAGALTRPAGRSPAVPASFARRGRGRPGLPVSPSHQFGHALDHLCVQLFYRWDVSTDPSIELHRDLA